MSVLCINILGYNLIKGAAGVTRSREKEHLFWGKSSTNHHISMGSPIKPAFTEEIPEYPSRIRGDARLTTL